MTIWTVIDENGTQIGPSLHSAAEAYRRLDRIAGAGMVEAYEIEVAS